MYVAFGHDEYRIAGSLLGEPLRTVKAISVDIEVPAEAEIVLEGYLHPDHRIEEGPVSEFHGYYELYGAGHGGEIVTVTHRRDPIYQAILPGSAAEHHLLGAEAIGATTCYGLRQVIPRVRQVVVTQGGMGRLHAVIAMHKPHSGEGKRAALLAMGWTNLLKKVTVVDDDIDPSDPTQVEWAVANRMRAEEDVSVLPNMKADRCDPQERNGTVAKMCIDATASRTKPPGGGRGMALPPQEVLQRIRDTLEEY
jgi:UbiD family decarboxylase